MSDRNLYRMTPEAIVAIIDGADGAIRSAEDAQRELDARAAYAARVEKALGYKPLVEAIKKETITTPVDVVLLKTLKVLGIIPLDRTSVHEYMDSMTKHRLNLAMKGFGFPLMIVGCISTLILVIVALSNPVGTFALMRINWIWPALAGIGFFLIWAEHAIIPRRSWGGSTLESFGRWPRDSKMLPKEALDIALRLNEVLPEAKCFVHQLVLERSHVDLFHPDPFLEVRFGNESYFVAVWDESGFDKKLREVA